MIIQYNYHDYSIYHDFFIHFNTIDTGIVSLNQSPSILQYDQQCNYVVCFEAHNTMINTYTTDYIINYNVPNQFSNLVKLKYTQILLLEVFFGFRRSLSPVDELVANLFSELSVCI